MSNGDREKPALSAADVASERRIPNAETRAAMAEVEAGKCKRFSSIDSLMADLKH